jgi:hypothetical protein
MKIAVFHHYGVVAPASLGNGIDPDRFDKFCGDVLQVLRYQIFNRRAAIS